MFSKRTESLTSSLVREILAVAQQPGMISFAGGLPDPELMPQPRWSDVPPAARQYGPTEGEPELRDAIAEEARGLGIACDASQVLVVSGSQQGIDLAAKLFVDPGTPVAVESPTYLAALQAFGFFGARFCTAPMCEGGLDPERLDVIARAERPALAYLIPTFQNPSGQCYSAQTRASVAEVLDRHNLPLLEDEPYRDLVYDECDRAPICAQISRAPWIYQGTFSKSFLPGIRVGYLIASPDLMQPLARIKQATDLHTNRPGQWLAQRWLTDPGRPAALEVLRAAYSAKRDAMHAALTRHFDGIAEWTPPPGGLFFWLTLNTRRDTRPLLPAMLERGVAFMPGEAFYPTGAEELGHMRLNFSHASAAQMNEGLGKIAEALG